jgi:hypothetical protein
MKDRIKAEYRGFKNTRCTPFFYPGEYEAFGRTTIGMHSLYLNGFFAPPLSPAESFFSCQFITIT